MMDILLYLFETYIHSDADFLMDQDELSEELLRAGFHQDDIYKALNWLEKLAALSEGHPYMTGVANNSMRIFTEEEMRQMDVSCRGMLTHLAQIGVLTDDTREMVIDRVMELEAPDFHLDDLKWIILMVLFNAPGHENAYHQMEDLLYGLEDGYLH